MAAVEQKYNLALDPKRWLKDPCWRGQAGVGKGQVSACFD